MVLAMFRLQERFGGGGAYLLTIVIIIFSFYLGIHTC